MRSPTAALLWEIWARHRSTIAAIGVPTFAARVVHFLDTGGGAIKAGADPSPLPVLLAMIAFSLLLGVFNYTESNGSRGLGRFPRRLFALPVTSLKLVAVPLIAGIVSMEVLYLLWKEPLSRVESMSAPFSAALLAAMVVFYLWALWTFESMGSLRLFMLGVIVVALFLIGVLPSFPPAPPPAWRSELFLTGLLAGLSVVVFLLTWRHVARLRSGGERIDYRAESFFGWVAEAMPKRQRAFTNPAAAQFWFEWRASGIVLPALVGAVLIVFVLPMSWWVRSDASNTFGLVLAALAAPVVLAIPVGMAFSKPTFWSDDLALPSFVAVRPLSSEDLVAVKVKVAAMSAGLAWLLVLVCLLVWLSVWGTLDGLSFFAIQLWAFHEHSVAAVYGIVILVAVALVFLTWRSLVSRLWSGLSGIRRRFAGSVLATVVLVVAGLAFDADRFPDWLVGDPARFVPLVWMASGAVLAKYWIAAYAWRDAAPRFFRLYALVWLAGTASFLALGMVAWGMLRIYVPVDVERVRSSVILLALLLVPLARVGLAPSSLARNRHRV
jgi:hypothetical protein